MEEKSIRDINEDLIYKLKELNSILRKIIKKYQDHEKEFSITHNPEQ